MKFKNNSKVKFVEEDPMTVAIPKENAKVLKIGEIYTVERVEVHTMHTKIFLKEHPNIEFNSVWFEIGQTPFEELLTKGEPTIQGILSVLCRQETDEDIRNVIKEYENYFINHHDDSVPKGTKLEIARRNIGYILGYIEPASERNRIYRALNDISHPIFGSGFGRT